MKWSDFFSIMERIGGRYFMFGGIAFLIFYVLFRNRWNYKKIQHRFPRAKDYLREIGYSILTIVIFTSVTVFFVKNPPVTKYTFYYRDIAQHGRLYFFAVFPLLFIIHDTYFYWMHRWMHLPAVFPIFHKVHHLSTNPSPWAAYAFHPLEAVVEAGILPVFLFTLPIHFFHLLIFFLVMIVYNVYGHLGWELYPPGFNKTIVGKWINTSFNHNQHHQFFKGNYGLYFTFWDRMMGTIRKDYDKKFEELGTRTREQALEIVH